MTAMIKMQQSEYEFHEAGVAQGRINAFREAAENLRKSKDHYLAEYSELAKENENVEKSMPTIEGWLSVFEALAKQFEAEAKRLEKTVVEHLNRGVALRPPHVPRLREKIIGAMMGAVHGYKTGSRSWQENESSQKAR